MAALKLSFVLLLLLILILVPVSIKGECTCDSEKEEIDDSRALKLKLVAIVTILVASFAGASLPSLGKVFPALRPEKDLFFIIKAFAAGVILSTGFIHVLPDAYESLTSPCLDEYPWRKFPFTGLVAMGSAIATLMVESFATSFYKRSEKNAKKPVDEEKMEGSGGGVVHVHTHASHGHSHGSALLQRDDESALLRHRIISKVLELGIIVHSVIIGISLGASQSPDTIRPLVAALTFHQFFEGMGLGGCITQAKFKPLTTTLMVVFFSLTTPLGIAVGFGISRIYDESSPTALIVEGLFNSASAGILIYMALVDLIAEDFMSSRMQSNLKLHMGANVALVIGAGCMSLLAIWA